MGAQRNINSGRSSQIITNISKIVIEKCEYFDFFLISLFSLRSILLATQLSTALILACSHICKITLNHSGQSYQEIICGTVYSITLYSENFHCSLALVTV